MSGSLRYIFTHVFFPPKLPQADDWSQKHDRALLETIRDSLKSFKERTNVIAFEECIRMVDLLINLRASSEGYDAQTLGRSLQTLTNRDIMVLHVNSQNAGLIIRSIGDDISFESFQLSPQAETVMDIKGRLQRSFPGPAILVPRAEVINEDFREPFVDALIRLDMEPVEQMLSTVYNAGSQTTENRGIAHPGLITEMLTGVLRAKGRPWNEVKAIRKNIRDDALCSGGKIPWRRSPLWLLLRVAIQTSLVDTADQRMPHRQYKSFMIFLLSCLLERALADGWNSDLIFIMQSKIARRLLKLNPSDEGEPWLEAVSEIITKSKVELLARWKVLEQNTDPLGSIGIWKQLRFDLEKDSELRLPKLQPYLKGVEARSRVIMPARTNIPQSSPRHRLSATTIPDFNLLNSADKSESYLKLSDHELWVRCSLERWLESTIHSEEDSKFLHGFFDRYLDKARPLYEGSPEDMSIMVLTALNLWVALDKFTVYHHPLLSDYSPEIELRLLEPLLLPKKIHIDCLRKISKYINSRISRSIASKPSILKSFGSSESFAVRFFEDSASHISLRQKIEDKAVQDKIAKQTELRSLKNQRQQWLDEVSDLTCEQKAIRRRGKQLIVHDSACRKCKLKKEAKNLSIELHEWPLPSDELSAKATVFELDIPLSFSCWRAATQRLLANVFSDTPRDAAVQKNPYCLSDYLGLQEFRKAVGIRVGIWSDTSPYMRTNTKGRKVSHLTEDSVCCENGMSYAMFDSKNQQWISRIPYKYNIRENCTFQIPDGPYKELQFALYDNKHSPNTAVTTAAAYQGSLTNHEVYSYISLRSGHLLQWRNISRELASNTLNFSVEEVGTLISQTIWQIGPGNETHFAESHLDLQDESFTCDLLSVLRKCLDRIEGNWQNVIALRTFTQISTRILSLSPHCSVQSACLKVICRLRRISLDWFRQITSKSQATQNKEDQDRLNQLTLDVALTCFGTYDVDFPYLKEIINDDEDVAILIEASITICDRCPATVMDCPNETQRLLRRHQRLSHSIQQFFNESHVKIDEGLNRAIHRLWPVYKPQNHWSFLNEPDERWVTTDIVSVNGQVIQLSYNILEGKLLVNGVSLSRLPRSYEAHQTFNRLFGQKILEVFPSTNESMEYESRGLICGLQLSFRMMNYELIVRVKKGDKTLEYVPQHAMRGDFPHELVENYVHWLDIDTKELYWHKQTHIWMNEPEFCLTVSGQSTALKRGTSRLIDVFSSISSAVYKLLKPLEGSDHINIWTNYGFDTFEVHLPRLRLDFYWEGHPSRLISKQFRGMYIDDNQSIRTLTGLVNKLVLRDKSGSIRMVIIPEGMVTYEREGNHVQVTISSEETHIPYHVYGIDDELGKLSGNIGLQSKLFLCYLHALTSHCLPDTLTGFTGTERSLDILGSAGVQSISKLDANNISLLRLLEDLTPKRNWCTSHLNVKQSVQWLCLSQLSHDNRFAELVGWIAAKVKKEDQFYEKHEGYEFDVHLDPFLCERATIRDSFVRTDGFGAERTTTLKDVSPSPKGLEYFFLNESRAYRITNLVQRWPSELDVHTDLLSAVLSWEMPVQGPHSTSFTFGYDPQFLSPEFTLSKLWCDMHHKLSRASAEHDKTRIALMLSTLVYLENVDDKLAQTLLALAVIPGLRQVRIPKRSLFRFTEGFELIRSVIRDFVASAAIAFDKSSEYTLPRRSNESDHDLMARRKAKYDSNINLSIARFTDYICQLWPVEYISGDIGDEFDTYFDVEGALTCIRPKLKVWFDNRLFRNYLFEMQDKLSELTPHDLEITSYTYQRDGLFQSSPLPFVSRLSMWRTSDIQVSPLSAIKPRNFTQMLNKKATSGGCDSLKSLLNRLHSQAEDKHQESYAARLTTSMKHLPKSTKVSLIDNNKNRQKLHDYQMKCHDETTRLFDAICLTLTHGLNAANRIALQATSWPRIAPGSLLPLLSQAATLKVSEFWKESLVNYALAILELKRAKRLVSYIGLESELSKELDNIGHGNWDPVSYPDWLLLELENDIVIRETQVSVCQEMVNPSSGANSIYQMDMGEGKTSVIVPMAITELADGQKLVRVVVLRSLCNQMFQQIVAKLGGMLGRRVYYLPLSRSVDWDMSKAKQLRELYEECIKAKGVFIVQQEQLLSFELIGADKFLSGEEELGTLLIQTQNWLDKKSRDILDESDEILSHRSELVYTMETQRAVDYNPDRWVIIQRVLGLAAKHSEQVKEEFPNGISREVMHPEAFPRLHILEHEAGSRLRNLISGSISSHGFPELGVWALKPDRRLAIYRFICDPNLPDEEFRDMERYMNDNFVLKKPLLLLRGLLAGGMIEFVLHQKRWRVDYGHDLQRSMLAVPYRAKDSPQPRSEFSHPDVSMVMTCLSYYYAGLLDEQLRTAFEKLEIADNAQDVYNLWVQNSCHLPDRYQSLKGVNLSDAELWVDVLFPGLRFSKGAIDFYISSIVFPQEMREFPSRLSASAWDIAKVKEHPTTGFSGTNDSAYSLPIEIQQRDRSEQLGTNAAVIDCLLRPENTFAHGKISGERSKYIESLLEMVIKADPVVRVIIDVGAQILEMTNAELAFRWLERVNDPEVQAAIFFDDDDDIIVLDRHSHTEPLSVSPFAKQMHRCLVYLDEVHTRGVDLKLPDSYRAAVTLGPRLEKDRLVQACKRMRKLGKGQSILFCAPPEIEREIEATPGRNTSSRITVEDIVLWSILQTFSNSKKQVALWVSQGLRYMRRKTYLSQIRDQGGSYIDLELLKQLLEPEAKSIEARYGYDAATDGFKILRELQDPELARVPLIFKAIEARIEEFNLKSLGESAFNEEQERELAPEIERECAVQHAPKSEPATHSIHNDVESFVKTGALDPDSRAFANAFKFFDTTTAAQLNPGIWPQSLLVTKDYIRTVKADLGSPKDAYLRPVHWILRQKNSTQPKHVIISPFEANELLPDIRAKSKVSLHVYSARTNLTMQPLDDLAFCSIGSSVPSKPSVILDLNIFAGQLYFRDFSEYVSFNRRLGLCHRPPDVGVRVAHDGFIDPSDREAFDPEMEIACSLTDSPVPFLKLVVSLRRAGQSIQTSHVGRVLNGERLCEDNMG